MIHHVVDPNARTIDSDDLANLAALFSRVARRPFCSPR
jgi:hypothetical protein